MRRFILFLVLAVLFPALPAGALTLREIIELRRAGLGDDVLVALIEVEKPVFAIDHETIKSLKAEGISERVMIAMIKSGRTPPPAAPVPAPAEAAAMPQPQIIVVEHRAAEQDEPRVREVAVPVAVPVYIPVQSPPVRRSRSRHVVERPLAPHQQPNLPIHLQPAPPRKAEPVYWGWGGKLRPDAWKPDGR